MEKRKLDTWMWLFCIGFIICTAAACISPGLRSGSTEARDAGAAAVAFLVLLAFRIVVVLAKPRRMNQQR